MFSAMTLVTAGPPAASLPSPAWREPTQSHVTSSTPVGMQPSPGRY